MGVSPIYWNRIFNVEFLDDYLRIKDNTNILQQSLFTILTSIERIANSRFFAILHVATWIPFRWLTCNTYKIAHRNWSVRSMGRVIDILHTDWNYLIDDPRFIHYAYIWNSNGWSSWVQILNGIPVQILNLSLCRIIKDKGGAAQESHQVTLHPNRPWQPRQHQCPWETYFNWYSRITWWVRRWEESHLQVYFHIWIRIIVGTFPSGCQKGDAQKDGI